MAKQLLGTFSTRDIADSVKGAFIDDGFNAHDLIVMANPGSDEPTEAAKLEVGTAGEGGFGGFEEKIGKSVRRMFGKKDRLNGDLGEGEPNMGALLAVTVADDVAEAKARQLFQFHRAADVEIAQED
jgi:hypothetical protein